MMPLPPSPPTLQRLYYRLPLSAFGDDERIKKREFVTSSAALGIRKRKASHVGGIHCGVLFSYTLICTITLVSPLRPSPKGGDTWDKDGSSRAASGYPPRALKRLDAPETTHNKSRKPTSHLLWQ
eukprot:jgi/Bigna1/80159/fgenesh1_pg.68_\